MGSPFTPQTHGSTLAYMTADAVHIPRMLTLEEVAELSGRTHRAVQQLRARQLRGEQVGPRFTKVDGRVLVSEDALVAWLTPDTPE